MGAMMGGRRSTSNERREVFCTAEGGIVEKSLARLVGSEGRLCTRCSLGLGGNFDTRYFRRMIGWSVICSWYSFMMISIFDCPPANSGGTLLQSPLSRAKTLVILISD